MVDITKIWTPGDPTRQDPGVPITSAWGNDVFDNLEFLSEWMGAGFLAGAAQDHNHDGVNSAKVNIFPNLMPGGSFEDVGATNESIGWTKNEYVGGTVTTTNAANIDGERSLAITSTVLANGGGQHTQDEYKAVSGSNYYPLQIYRWASVSNISSRIELIWYDASKTQISIATILNETNTPTSPSIVNSLLTAPANARFVRTRLTGGVPGLGSATGTVYFDGGYIMPSIPQNSIRTVNLIDSLIITQKIAAQAVTEPKLGTGSAINRVLGASSVTDSKINKAIGSSSSQTLISNSWTPAAGLYNIIPFSALATEGLVLEIYVSGWRTSRQNITGGLIWFDGSNMRITEQNGATVSLYYQKLG